MVDTELKLPVSKDNSRNENNSANSRNTDTKPVNSKEVQKESEGVNDIESKHVENDASKLSTSSKAEHEPQDVHRQHFVLGEYDIAIPDSKFTLLAVMASSIIFLVAILMNEKRNYRDYGISLSIVSLIVAIVSFITPNKCTFVIQSFSYFLLIWTFVGACIMTFEDGPFVKTGNGYFASWGCAYFSALAVPILHKMNTILTMGATTTVVLISLTIYLKDDYKNESYEGETIYAMTIAILTICAGILFSFKYWRKGSRSCFESQILIVFSFLWIIEACAVTFSGPFLITGNGYFASWATAILSSKAASYFWKHRTDQD